MNVEHTDYIHARREAIRKYEAEFGVPWLEDSTPIYATELVKLRAENERLRSRCVCAFCKTEFSKTNLDDIADHLMKCEQSPLVKRIQSLCEKNRHLQWILNTVQQEAKWLNQILTPPNEQK